MISLNPSDILTKEVVLSNQYTTCIHVCDCDFRVYVLKTVAKARRKRMVCILGTTVFLHLSSPAFFSRSEHLLWYNGQKKRLRTDQLLPEQKNYYVPDGGLITVFWTLDYRTFGNESITPKQKTHYVGYVPPGGFIIMTLFMNSAITGLPIIMV